MDRQIIPQNAITTVSQNFDNWLTHGLAASSIEMYKMSIKAYQEFASDSGLDPMSHQTLRAWRDWMLTTPQANGKLKSSNTINRMLSAIKRVVKEAKQREIVDDLVYARFKDVEGVKIDPKRLKKTTRTKISKDDLRRLCESPGPSRLIGLRDRALLHTLASSGIRASELATLKQSQIEKQDNGLYLLKVMGKNEIEPASAFLNTEAYNAIQGWLIARPFESEYIFTSFKNRGLEPLVQPMTRQAVWDTLQKYAGRCGLKHITPHTLRRYLGTILAKEDIRLAQKALRHRRIQTTADHYVLDELEAGKTEHIY